MSNFGFKNSDRRSDWWDDVVKPISWMLKKEKKGGYFTSKKSWMKATGPSKFGPGGAFEKKHIAQAKKLAEHLGVKKLATPHLVHNLTKSKAFVAELRAARASSPTASTPAPAPPLAPPEPTMTAEESAAAALGDFSSDTSTFAPMPAQEQPLPAVSMSMIDAGVDTVGTTEVVGMGTGVKVAIGVTILSLLGGTTILLLRR